jgi:AcrR family transcriptional regulator
VLRDGDGPGLREYLIATAARLIDQRGGARLAVRDIAREAQVADGVLYNYFEDKEDLLAQALLAHVGTVMSSVASMPQAGTGTVAENLRLFIDRGLDVLARITPAFATLLSQPKVLGRFHAMVGGDAAFGSATADDGTDAGAGGGAVAEAGGGAVAEAGDGADATADGEDAGRHADYDAAEGDAGRRGLPESLTIYLRAEQRLGRIDPAADVDAAAMLIVGAIHGQVLPRVLFSPPGTPVTAPPGFAARLADTVLGGIAPR